MTDEELQAIRERVEKATAGPWKPHVVTCCGLHYDHPGGGQHTNVSCSWATGPVARSGVHAHADAAFISCARADIPALLSEVDGLRAALKEFHEYHEKLKDENASLRQKLEGFAERIAAQSEVLTKRAEKK